MARKISKIFEDRANAQEKRVDDHWPCAKSGEGDHH